jgi:phosphoserine phosphatase
MCGAQDVQVQQQGQTIAALHCREQDHRAQIGGGELSRREAGMADELPSWTDGPAKAQVLEFVRSVTEPGPSFVPPPGRVAAFDNDGTLWCEKPMYPQADFLLRRWAETARAHPGLAKKQPWKAVTEGDQVWLAGILDHVPELTHGVTEAYAGITVEAFERAVRAFFDTARHPVLGVPYTRLAYRPMRELIDLLRAAEFEVYLCSAGCGDFVRVVAEEMYGIPRQHVIGSGTALEYRHGEVYRAKGVEQPVHDGPGKAVHLWARAGRKPLLAAGNADGDAAMLRTARFGLLIRHDDAGREFAYDVGAEKALAKAKERGWTVVSMQNDFKVVFDL